VALALRSATAEQATATASVVKDADQVRKGAKQTARATAEQASVVAALAAGAVQQTRALQGLGNGSAAPGNGATKSPSRRRGRSPASTDAS
jgi:hypothetical protein